MSHNELLEVIDKAYTTLFFMAHAETLGLMRRKGICGPLHLRYMKRGNKITIIDSEAHIFGGLATVTVTEENNHVTVLETTSSSMLTATEAEGLINATDNRHNFLPAEDAVEILSRNTPSVHTIVEEFLESESPRANMNIREAVKALTMINLDSVHIITALPSLLDDCKDRRIAIQSANSRFYSEDSLVGAEEIIYALLFIRTTIQRERKNLLASIGQIELVDLSRSEYRVKHDPKDCEAVNKLIKRACLVGAPYPTLLAKALGAYPKVFASN